MACCPSNILFFTDVLSTTIGYSTVLKTAFGARPRVDVYYYDEDVGEFYTDNGTPASGTLIKFAADTITIDHGGLASGYVKIS